MTTPETSQSPSTHPSQNIIPSGVQDEDIDRQLGKKLKMLRLQAGKTQSAIADYLQISAQQYQKYEKGATKCSISTLYKLSGFYNLPVISFLPENSTKKNGFNEEAKAFKTDPEGALTDEAAAVAELLAIFIRIPSKTTRRKLLDLLDDIF